jgi:outer membrane protein assembly factor BamB
MTERILALFLFALLFSNLLGQQDSQWRGPDRNGSYEESNLLKEWPEEGPELLWYSDQIGNGHSSASVTENSLYVTGREDSLEYLSCFDLKGTLRWKVPFGKRWQGAFPDSRSTPNVVDHKGMIYISKGYDYEGVMFSISPDSEKIEQVWSDTVLDKHLGVMAYNIEL